MKSHTKILVWENKNRLNKLNKFRRLVIKYFNNSYVEPWAMGERTEENDAQAARTEINRVVNEVRSIIHSAGINTGITFSAVRPIISLDLLSDIFNLHRLDIPPNNVIDVIDKAIGEYHSNHKSALRRAFNPLFYLGRALDVISHLPFIALRKLGFNKQKVEGAATGRLKYIPIVAAVILILEAFEIFEPVKQFVHELLDYGKAN